MKVYLAWSGERSRRIAALFASWLPAVPQSISVFYSPSDADEGARWESVISEVLEGCNAGILILTPDNLQSRWIHFEAGALSKSVDGSRVTPILVGVRSSEIEYPLAQLQHCEFGEEELLKLLRSLNAITDRQVDDAVLVTTFVALWPGLLQDVNAAAASYTNQAPNFDTAAAIAEILGVVRYTAAGVQAMCAQACARRSARDLVSTGTEFRVGQKVRHPAFGVGIVLKVTGRGSETIVEAVFPNVGPKQLMLAYAKLQPVAEPVEPPAAHYDGEAHDSRPVTQE